MGVTSSLHNMLLIPGHGISFQTMAWHSCFYEHHETRMLQKAVHIPACSEMGQDDPSPVYKFYAKSTDDRHHQTQCLDFLQDSSQGRQSKQDFLRVLVWLKIFYIYFYTKKMQPEHFPVHLGLHRHCPFPRLSLLEGCSHGCVQHKACSRLSPDQSSRDNQVR